MTSFPGGRSPLVSICIPAFDGARYLEDALRSALAQTWDDLEVVVVDGGSTDGTVRIAQSIDDARVRVVESGRNDGMVRNWNRTLEQARGRYIKFLFQDDLLAPACVERMVAVFERNPSVGLVFSPREIITEAPDDTYTQEWLTTNRDVHVDLGPLDECNDGRRLAMDQADKAIHSNSIGEPTVVMIDRVWFERLGTFNLQMRQLVDLEMWLRVLYHSDAGFVPEPLASFRVHGSAATAANRGTGVGWMDRLWLIEGLLRLPDLDTADERTIRDLRGPVVRAIARHEAWRVRHGRRASVLADGRALREYGAYRVALARGRSPAIHGSMPEHAGGDGAIDLGGPR